MNKVIKHTLLLSLLGAFLGGGVATTPGRAEETAPVTSARKGPVGLPARIVSVDKRNKILVVEIKGHIYRFKMSPQVTFFKNGNVITLDDVTAGQHVSLVTGPAKDGDMEVVALTIEPNPNRSEAAGGGQGPASPPSVPASLPPQSGGRPPISPYR